MGCTNGIWCLFLTSTHDVVSEEWSSEPQRQHKQVAGKAWKHLLEARSIGAEVGKGSCHQHAMRMEAQDVVVSGVQVSCLHKLMEETRTVCKLNNQIHILQAQTMNIKHVNI